jgi:hypothetical protein
MTLMQSWISYSSRMPWSTLVRSPE